MEKQTVARSGFFPIEAQRPAWRNHCSQGTLAKTSGTVTGDREKWPMGSLSNKDGDGYESHLKREFALLQNLSRLFHLVYFVKCWQMFLELNSKGLYQSSGKEKKVVFLCSRLRQNVNLGTLTL